MRNDRRISVEQLSKTDSISKTPLQIRDATRQLRESGSRNLGYVHLKFNSASFHFAKDVLTLGDIISDWFSLNENDLMQDAEQKRI